MTGRGSGRVPVHRSLLTRLMLTCLLIAMSSIAATAWLAVTTTTRAVQQEQGQALSSDARIYAELLGYAARHRTWNGVQTVIDDLAARNDRRIWLTTPDRQLIAASRSSRGVPPVQATANIDPLRVDLGLLPAAGPSQIDPRAQGPYRLSKAERRKQVEQSLKPVACPQDAVIVAEPCTGTDDDPRVAGDYAALARLNRLIAGCLKRKGLNPVTVTLDFQLSNPAPTAAKGAPEQWDTCVWSSRREQLKSYVAPAAMLFSLGPGSSPQKGFTLSRAGIIRIVLVTGAVLVLTMLLTLLVGRRLVRPLRALIDVVRLPPDQLGRVPVTTNNEIGYLAAAFNDLSARRELLEAQRVAMISDIAHELRTPLSNVRGWLQAAEDDITPRDQVLTASLLEEALHLQRIIDDLQDLAQADAGELQLRYEAVHLGELVTLVAHTHRGGADLAGVTLITDPGDVPPVDADPTRLRQAVSNLVSNAVRHTPAGGTVTLKTYQQGGDAYIDVTDTGGGIEAEELPHVFDRFWRADKSRNRGSGGSGLGLAITRQFVQAHGGDVTVTSIPHERTTFTVRLPAQPGDTR